MSTALSIGHYAVLAYLYNYTPAGGLMTGSSGLVANSGILPFNFSLLGSASFCADLTTCEWNGALELAGTAFLLRLKESSIRSSSILTSSTFGFSYNL